MLKGYFFNRYNKRFLIKKRLDSLFLEILFADWAR